MLPIIRLVSTESFGHALTTSAKSGCSAKMSAKFFACSVQGTALSSAKWDAKSVLGFLLSGLFNRGL